ncbi:hypothetical protein [Burkholderia singularis]|uniref:hypothetical protein n=1 Tax=Burkholderia singularis TaxID=1503053 RepID=UPI00117EC342|nr:hypothetical protein [Burkholderia singularis]
MTERLRRQCLLLAIFGAVYRGRKPAETPPSRPRSRYSIFFRCFFHRFQRRFNTINQARIQFPAINNAATRQPDESAARFSYRKKSTDFVIAAGPHDLPPRAPSFRAGSWTKAGSRTRYNRCFTESPKFRRNP